MGGRCLLAPAVLHHPPGHHGAAAALSEQPEVHQTAIRQLSSISGCLYSHFSVGCGSLGFLILL